MLLVNFCHRNFYHNLYVLWHIYCPSFSGFWHCHSYILQHFYEIFLLLYPINHVQSVYIHLQCIYNHWPWFYLQFAAGSTFVNASVSFQLKDGINLIMSVSVSYSCIISDLLAPTCQIAVQKAAVISLYRHITLPTSVSIQPQSE